MGRTDACSFSPRVVIITLSLTLHNKQLIGIMEIFASGDSNLENQTHFMVIILSDLFFSLCIADRQTSTTAV